MMILICCICDDNIYHLQHMTALFQKHVADDTWQCETFSDPQTIINFLRHEKAQLVIMDIDLGDKNGIECVKEIHTFQPSVIVIFVSANIEFCSSVYAVDHVYFLPKPIRETVFGDALQKALKQINTQQHKSLIIKNKNLALRVMFDEILYIESDRRKLIYHTRQGLLESYGSLDTLFETLDQRFIHCHKSFAVNMDFVKQHHINMFLMANRESIPISQLKQSHTKTVFLNYIGGKL